MNVRTLYIARTADGIGLELPSYDSRFHVGLNLQAAVASAVRLEPGDRVYVPCGFAIGVPDGYCGQVVSLPKVAKELGLIVLDAPHIVHPADRGPLFLLLQNTSVQQVVLHRGDYVAQLVVMPVVQATWKEISDDVKKDDQIGGVKGDTVVTSGFVESAGKEANKMVSLRRVYKSARHRFSEDQEGEGNA